MDSRTLEALRGSIRKWEKIVAGDGGDCGVANCPLCQLFYDDGCTGCPVERKTGNDNCDGSPYEHWSDISIKIPDPVMVPPEGDPRREEMLAAAQAELDFLKSLLPGAKT